MQPVGHLYASLLTRQVFSSCKATLERSASLSQKEVIRKRPSHDDNTRSNINKSNSTSGGRASRGKSAGDIRFLCNFFYSKCITRKCLTLKMKVKDKAYNIRNGPIRWQISTPIKIILEYFR